MQNWTKGNEFTLLENGEEFFPRLFERIREAEREVLLETFIWFEDKVGREFQETVIEAAERGVRVRILVDGYGSPSFSEDFMRALVDAGVKVQSFDPQPKVLGYRTNLLCRLHTKIAVIDEGVAFIGGINLSEVHLRSYDGKSTQDYALEVTGPVVADLHDYCSQDVSDRGRSRWRHLKRWKRWIKRTPIRRTEENASGEALLVTRDNNDHQTDIELMYRAFIRGAKREIVIANAYFFPRYKFIRDLNRAAKRGVKITLILQGNPDVPISARAASLLYDDLLDAGITVCHYNERPLHAKVAIIDDSWVTIGSSNLDPFSLGFNIEANLFVADAGVNSALRESLDELRQKHCETLTEKSKSGSLLLRLVRIAAYRATRRMTSWGHRSVSRQQQIQEFSVPAADSGA